jgi:hypothetical protein
MSDFGGGSGRLEDEYKSLLEYKERIEAQLAYAKGALALIATPKRSDGTYNRSREACEQLAKETLEKLND